MIWIKPAEMKNGNFRMVETSDESESHFVELCKCENGHATPEEAKECVYPPKVKEIITKFDKDAVINALFEMACDATGVDGDAMIMLFKLEYVNECKKDIWKE